MIYDCRREVDALRLAAALERALSGKRVVEFHEKTKRTLNQNSYLHLVIALVADEIGVTPEYCKTVYFKRLVNAPLFVRKVHDRLAGDQEMLLSSSDLSKEDMSTAIDRFVSWARTEMCMLIPSPGDKELLYELEIEMAKKHYL